MPIKPPRVQAKASLNSDFAGKNNQDSKSIPSIPGYRILKRIGEGGMGKVFLARDEILDRNVAIKMISDKVKSSDVLKRRFLREAKAMAKLEHPNVGRIYTLVKHENEFYYIMENIEGESLAQRLKRINRCSVNESLRILKKVILALEAAWERKVIHRDIKPANIIIDKREQVKVIDFGLAKTTEIGEDSSFTKPGVVLGTPHYISPELIKEEPVDFRSDIYSAGIMLYEMLVGECPFIGTAYLEVINKHLYSSLPSIKEKRPDVPDEVQKLFEWMTWKDPQERPYSYPQLLDFIDSIEKGQAPLHVKDIRQHKRKRISLKPVAIVSGVLLFLISLGIVSGLFFGKKVTKPVPGEEKRLVVAAAPFYGPDEDSAKEGLVMAALVEKSIKKKLSEKNVKVKGIKYIKEPIQDHETARKIGKELNADIVVWGEAFAVRGETEIQPYLTMIPQKKELMRDPVEVFKKKTGLSNLRASSLDIHEKSGQAVIISAEMPNQIELRKTTARGIGDMVLLMAGLHALNRENNTKRALSFFSRVPKSSDSLRYSAYALLHLNKVEEALKALKKSVSLDPKNARSYALMGDIYMDKREFQHAVKAYKAASETGRTYTTQRAIYFDNKLFVKEVFKSKYFAKHRRAEPDKVFETRYMLACNPISGQVIERYCLPGVPKSFKIQKNSIYITYRVGSIFYPVEDEIIFSNGKFNRPVFYGWDVSLRLSSIYNGMALAANFFEPFPYPEEKFTLKQGKLFDDVPTDLEELKKCLGKAIKNDPTQPWHLFLLGQTLWAQEQKEEAEKPWQGMISGEFPSIPYYEYSYMAYIFELFGQEEWADRAYEEALKRRKQFPRSIGTIYILELWTNTAFIRQAAVKSKMGKDMERAYLWLERSREISGLCMEYGDLAAMLWEKYFREHGDVERANKEAAISNRMKENPLNWRMAYGCLEYATLTYGIALFGFLVFSLIIFTAAFKRSEFKKNSEKKGWMWLNLPRWVDRLSLTIAVVMTAVLLLSSIEDLDWKFIVSITVFILLLILFLSSRNFSLRVFASSISRSERNVLIISLLLVLIAAFWGYSTHRSYVSVALIPWGFSDSLGHSAYIHDTEEWLKERNTYENRYVVAVMNHLAGNAERASELYETFPHDLRAQKNLAALKKGNLNPPVPLTAKDIFRGYKVGPGENWFEYIYKLSSFYLYLRIILILQVILILFSIFLVFVFLRTPANRTMVLLSPSDKIRRRLAKILFFLIPGMFDIRRGSPLRGWLIISLFLFVLFTGLFVFNFDIPVYYSYSFNIFRSRNRIFVYNTYPLPHSLSNGEDLVDFFRWEILLAYPWTKIFWSSVILSLIIFPVFHIARFRKIWRLYKRE